MTDSRITACRSCGAPIIWLRTKAEKHIPVDAASVTDGTYVFDSKQHQAHWSTCPQADAWRKKRGGSR